MLMPFPCRSLVRRQALRALGKAAKVLRKAGTRDAGPCSPTGPIRAGRPFSSRPGSSGERALYADFAGVQGAKTLQTVLSGYRLGAQPVVDRPDLVGQADRHRGALAQTLRALRLVGQMLHPVEHVEELLQASGEQHLLEARIRVRARKEVLLARSLEQLLDMLYRMQHLAYEPE